jgi:hypothetical protein
MKEEEKENQVVVNVSKFDAGKEIIQGIHCVDSAREQLISARKAIKKIQLTKLKGPLLKLADQWGFHEQEPAALLEYGSCTSG